MSTLDEWNSPAITPPQEAFLDILRTSALLEHSAVEGLKPRGLTLTQFNVLRILRGAGPDGLCRNEVGARMIKPVPDVTRLLDRLEMGGLVARSRSDADRRYVTARITERGLALLAELDEPILRLHEKQLGHMTESRLRQLAELLREARAGV
ncbi:MAG: MarR family transcriptional regulator [Gemmatimonadales bacterium]